MSVLRADILVKAAAHSKGLEGYRKILTTNATSNRELRQTFLKTGCSGGPVTGTTPGFKAPLKQEWNKILSNIPIPSQGPDPRFSFKSEVKKCLRTVWTKQLLFRCCLTP